MSTHITIHIYGDAGQTPFLWHVYADGWEWDHGDAEGYTQALDEANHSVRVFLAANDLVPDGPIAQPEYLVEVKGFEEWVKDALDLSKWDVTRGAGCVEAPKCPLCGGVAEFWKNYDGKTVKCPGCGGYFTIRFVEETPVGKAWITTEVEHPMMPKGGDNEA